MSNSNAFNSPLTSETRTFTSTAARPLIKIEQINNTNTATLSEHDLDDGEITFTDDAYPSNQICIVLQREILRLKWIYLAAKVMIMVQI